jgi:hypothetical protein
MPEITVNLIRDMKELHEHKMKTKPPFFYGLRTGVLRAWLFATVKVLFLVGIMSGLDIAGKIEENIALLDQYVRNDFTVASEIQLTARPRERNPMVVQSPARKRVIESRGAVAAEMTANTALAPAGQVASDNTASDNTASRNTVVVNNYTTVDSKITEQYVDQVVRYNLVNAIAARWILPGTGSREDGCLQIDYNNVVTTRGSRCGGGGGGGSSITTLGMGDTITSATQGSVLFAGASGVLAQDNTNFFFDDATNNLTVGGDLSLGDDLTVTGLAGSGVRCLQTDNTGAIAVAAAACSTSSQTPWTSSIDADGFALQDALNLEFRTAAGSAPAGTVVAIFQDNSGDLTGNVLTGKTFNIAVNGTDEYNFSSTALAMNSNNITGVGTTISGAAGVTLSSTAANLTLQTLTAGSINITAQDGVVIQSGEFSPIVLSPASYVTHIGGGIARTSLRFLEPSGTGTDYAAIQSNANVTTSYTWTLPAADASGCIQSNGSGTLSISACSGAASLQASYSGGNTIETASNTAVVITETGGAAQTGDLLQLTYDAATGGNNAGDALQITLDAADANGTDGNGINIVIDQSQNTGNAILVQDDLAATLFALDEDGQVTLGTVAGTTAVTITDTDYTNALSLGDNDITGTTFDIIGTTGNIDLSNFDVVGSSGNITTAGTLAVNGDSITADGATLIINAAGAVDIQDNVTADALTADTGAIAAAGVLQAGTTTTVAYSRLGVGTTGHLLDAANDLLISDDLEVDGDAFFDGNLTVTGTCTGCGGGSFSGEVDDTTNDALTFTSDDGSPPAGTVNSIFRDNTGDMNINTVTGKTLNLQIAGADEYNFSSTALAMNSNNITGVGTTISGAAGITLSSTAADLALATATSGNITLAPAGTGNVRITSNGTTGSGSASGLSVASTTITSGNLVNLDISGTAGLTNQKGLRVSLSGANSTASQTTYGGYFTNTHTGTSSTNIALYSTASGATTNYAAMFEGGDVALRGGTGLVQTITTTPVVEGSLADTTNMDAPIDVFVQGKYAYVVSDTNDKLTILDVSNPASPVVEGTLTDATNLDGSRQIIVSGRYAYVAAFTGNRLTVIDVANPNSPSIAGSLNDATNLNNIRNIYLSGKYIYASAQAGDRLTIVDVSDPTAPTVTGSLNDATNLDGPRGIYVTGKYAYVAALDTNRLTVVDVSNPASPSVTGSVQDNTNLSGPIGVYASGKYVYVTGNIGDTLSIVDVSNPASPSVAGTLTDATNLDGPTEVFVSGRYAYVAAVNSHTFGVVDISNPASPTLATFLADSTNLNALRGVYISGKYAFTVSGGNDRLTVIDLTGIDSPGATIGNLASNDINVTENAIIGNSLYVQNGLNVGGGGILANGILAVQAAIGSDYVASFFNDGNNANRYGIEIQAGADDASGTTYYLNALDGNGDQVGYIANTSGTFALTDPSDLRTKTNIENSRVDAMAILTGLRVVDYNRLQDPDGPKITGFIAQEVQAVYPKIVTQGENGILGITKENLIPVLVKGFQDQQSQVAALQNQINALQGNASGNLPGDTPVVIAENLYLSGDSVGEAKILEGVSSVRVSFAKPYKHQPIVTITPQSRVSGGYWVGDKDSTGFTIYIENGAEGSVTFGWHSFASEGAKLTVSDGTTEDIVLIVGDEPQEEVAGESTENPGEPSIEAAQEEPPFKPAQQPKTEASLNEPGVTEPEPFFPRGEPSEAIEQ